jgi:hypothetical protein
MSKREELHAARPARRTTPADASQRQLTPQVKLTRKPNEFVTERSQGRELPK